MEGQTEYLNCRSVTPRRIEVRGAFGLVASVYTQQKTEVLTALADGGIEQQLTTLEGVRRAAVLDKLITVKVSWPFRRRLPPSWTLPGQPPSTTSRS